LNAGKHDEKPVRQILVPQEREPPTPVYQPSPPNSFRKKKNDNLRMLAVLGVFALIITILILASANLTPPSEQAQNNDTNNTQSIEGTWSTYNPVTFYLRVDNGTGSGGMDAGYEIRNVTMVITGTAVTGFYDVIVYFSTLRQVIDPNVSILADVTSMLFQGNFGLFDQTTLNIGSGQGGGYVSNLLVDGSKMVGSWNETASDLLRTEEIYTNPGDLVLYRTA
jgi:hypothetical protein